MTASETKHPMEDDNVPQSGPRPFDGRGKWLDRPMSKLSYPERCERIRGFLREYSITLPNDFVEVLGFCNTRAEVWFIREIITSTGWTRSGPQTLTNGLYKLTVQADVGRGIIADILFEDLIHGLRVAFQIDYPQSLPHKIRAKNTKLAAIRSRVNRLIMVRADQSRSLGKSFRVDLMKDRLKNPAACKIQQHEPTPHKFWNGTDLAYDVSGLEQPERRATLRQWLSSRPPIPDEWVEVLLRCTRAGELHFALQLLSLPHVTLQNERFIIHDLYAMSTKVEVEGQSVDFLFEPLSTVASRSRSVIRINPPRFQAIDVRANLAADTQLLNAGYHVYREQAEKAKVLGYQWRNSIITDVSSKD